MILQNILIHTRAKKIKSQLFKNSVSFHCFIFCCFFCNYLLQAKEAQTIYIGNFQPYQNQKNNLLQEKIRSSLQKKLENKGYIVKKINSPTISEDLKKINNRNAYYINGYYDIKPSGNLDIYGQIYDPENQNVIDAYNETEKIEGIEDIGDLQLPEEETREKPEKTINKFSKKIITRIRSNPNKAQRSQNINDFIQNSSIGKKYNFPIQSVSVEKQGEDVFRLLEETKVVTAARKAQSIADAPSKIIVITNEQIRRRGYRTIIELLQDQPGFEDTMFHDQGEHTNNYVLRGIQDGGQTTVLVMQDGIIINDIENGWNRHISFDNTFIDIDRVEIILGPGSALYGANAYVGLINIITKKANQIIKEDEDGGTLTLSATGGSFNTYAGNALAAYKFNNGLIMHLAMKHFSTKGDMGNKRSDPGNYWHNNYEPDIITTTEYGKVANDLLPGHARQPITDGFNTNKVHTFARGGIAHKGFTFGFNIWEYEEGIGGFIVGYEYFSNDKDRKAIKKNQGYYVHTGYETDITKKLSTKTKIYYRNIYLLDQFNYTYKYKRVFDIHVNGEKQQGVIDKNKYDYGRSNLLGFYQQISYQFSASNDLITGVQIEKIQTTAYDSVNTLDIEKPSDNNNIITSAYPTSSINAHDTRPLDIFYYHNIGVFVQDEQKITDRYSLTIGGRYDYNSDYGVLWTPRAGFVGNPFHEFRFKLLYGEAFKAPAIIQMYAEFNGNPNLKPQKVKTSEVELSQKIFKYGVIKIGYFFSKLISRIEIAPNPNDGKLLIGPNGEKLNYYQNLEPTHMYGYLAEIAVNITKNLYLFSNYSFIGDRKIKTPLKVNTNSVGNITSISLTNDGHEVYNSSARRFNIGMNLLLLNHFNINLRMNWSGKRKASPNNRYYSPYDFDFIRKNYPYMTEGKPDGYMEGYTLYNLTLTWFDFLGIHNLEPQLIIRNLFNTPYMGIGRINGAGTRPIDAIQPTIQNPSAFGPPYHPQPGREIFFKITYQI